MQIKRIVPVPAKESLHIKATSPPQLIYNNGPLLSSVQIFSLFWGKYWQQTANKPLVNDLNEFFRFIVTSSQMEQLGEYSTDTYPIKKGAVVGTTTSIAAFPTSIVGKTVVKDARIQTFIQDEIGQGTAPPTTPNMLYFVFLPPGATVSLQRSFSCSTFCGYHNTFQNVYYAVVPYPCKGCLNGLAVLDAMTAIASHELCEAITDPVPGTGWYDQNYGEIGDICVAQTKKLGNYTVQLEWSNSAHKCV